MSIVDYNMQNPMAAFFQSAGGLQQLQANKQQMEMNKARFSQEEQQMAQAQATQARMQELLPLVQAGDYKASIELATINPQVAEAINKAKSNMQAGQDKITANWIAGYQAAADKDAYLSKENPEIDIDDQFRQLPAEQRDVLTRIVGAQFMPEQMFNATFGQPMTDFQVEDLIIKRDNTRLRALEAEYRRAQQSLDAETNQLKRQELQAKVDSAQQKVIEQKQKLETNQKTAEMGKANAIEAASIAEELLNDPSLDGIVGTVQGRLPTFSGQSQDLINKATRLQSLLTADNLKMMTGVLTDRDISFLTNIASGLNVTDSGILGSEKGVKERLKQIAGKIRSGIGAEPQTQQASGGSPAAGEVQQGYRFKGGNPADPNAWEKI